MMAQLSRALALIPSTACLFFGQQAPPESSPTFHSETELVLTTFNVVRGLYFAPDVKPDDILLLVDGKPRGFTVFEGPGTGRRPPLDLVLLFDTTTFPPPASKIKVLYTHWDRQATYDFTSHWDDKESRGVLEKGGADVRVSVYRYDHQQLQRLCRSTSDPQTLTDAIHRLPEPIPSDEAIPLTLPPNRETLEDFIVEHSGGFKRKPTDPLYWPISWTMEAMIATLRDSSTAPDNAIRVLAVFSEGGAHGSDSDPPTMRVGYSPTTTTAHDVADQANAFGIPVYPVVLDLDEYVLHAFARDTDTGVSASALPMVRFGSVGELTGGKAFYPSRIDTEVVNDILDAIRDMGLSRYVVGFAPPPSGRRREHTLEVKLRSKSSGKLVGGKRTAAY